ncbi:MAG: hypothetical protein JXB07_10650 [Anaerolineae bacterium]|nr:hypothetical protein [Anaerolineae bacterium]
MTSTEVEPLRKRDRRQLRPLPQAAIDLLQQHHVPPRLIAHLILVHDIADQISETQTGLLGRQFTTSTRQSIQES